MASPFTINDYFTIGGIFVLSIGTVELAMAFVMMAVIIMDIIALVGLAVGILEQKFLEQKWSIISTSLSTLIIGE